jgi:peptidyl-prolyl cis-trans isomerase SurA
VFLFLNEQLDIFSENAIREYEKDMLVQKYPDFKYILQEYHDGILLFDLTDKMVWSKAVQDTVGLEKFYEANKSQYMWGKRADVMIFSSDSTELLASARALAVKYGKKKKFSPEFVLSKLCKNDSVKNCIDIKMARFEKGDNEQVDKTNWVYGAGENYTSEGLTSFVFVRGVIEPQIKKLDEAKGLITADYQNFLEKAWIAELRVKYPVQVDRELLKTIK